MRDRSVEDLAQFIRQRLEPEEKFDDGFIQCNGNADDEPGEHGNECAA